MNAESLISATKDLGERFRVLALLPTVVLALFVLGLVWSGAPEHAPDVGQVAAHTRRFGGWQALLIALTVLVVALILEPLQVATVRTLEGYWGEAGIGRLLAAPGKTVHRARRARLDELQRRRGDEPPTRTARREEAARKLAAYPPADAVLPTKLGNVLRAAELRAGSPYGLDALTTWPRLYPLLGERMTALVDDLRNQLDLSVRFCSVFLVATVTAATSLAQHGWWLAVAAVPLLLAWLSNRAAVAAAGAYGQALAAAFDLHRFDLLDALHLPLPVDLTREIAANQQLSRFLHQTTEYVFAVHQGKEEDFAYDHRRPAVPAPAPERTGLLARLTRLVARGRHR